MCAKSEAISLQAFSGHANGESAGRKKLNEVKRNFAFCAERSVCEILASRKAASMNIREARE